jgi:hypothetical protein
MLEMIVLRVRMQREDIIELTNGKYLVLTVEYATGRKS